MLCNLSFGKLPPALAGGYKSRRNMALAKGVRLKPLVLAYLIH